MSLNLTNLIAILGGWSVVLLGISKFLSNLSINKLKISWKAAADKELATHQSELDYNKAVLNNIYTQYTSGFHIGQERRIKSIEILWTNLRALKEYANTRASSVYNILDEKEILNFWKRTSDNLMFQASKGQLKGFEELDFLDGFHPFCEVIDNERPFLGELIYKQYNVYKLYLGRISHIITEGAKKEAFIHWHDDAPLVELLKSYLNEAEFKYIMSQKLRSFELTCNLLETKLLGQINKLISGDVVTENALEMIRKFDSISISKQQF